jgi:hypothetical protein
MSDRIIQGFSEMKNIYISQILNEEKGEEDCEAGEEYEKNYKKTGKKAKKDWDRDGKIEDEADEYAGEINNAIHKNKSKKDKKEDDMKTESFSNWRNDLNEVISKIEPKVKDIDSDKEITERPVKNKIVLNPAVTEKFEVLSTEELDEDFIYETSYVAADYFREFGLNENGLEMVIDYLGEDKFLEYVFCITEDYFLTEERAAKKAQKPETVEQVKAKIAAREAKAAAKKAARTATKTKQDVAKSITTDKGNQAVKAAVQQQNPKAESDVRSNTQRIHDIWKKGMEENDKAINKIKTTFGDAHRKYKENIRQGNTPSQALGKLELGKAANNVASETNRKYKEAIKQGQTPGQAFRSLFNSFDGWVGGLIDEGYDLSTITAEQLVEQYNFLLEKAVSEHQQKLFGLALSVKRGETPRSEVGSDVLKIVDEMSMSEIRKFAGTKHKGLPATKE